MHWKWRGELGLDGIWETVAGYCAFVVFPRPFDPFASSYS